MLRDPIIIPIRAALILVAAWVLGARALATDLVVGNATDVVNGTTTNPAALLASPGSDGISLREAITACNNAAGPHTISFSASLSGQSIALASGLRITRDGITLVGNLGSDGKPGITLTAPSPTAAAIVIDLAASDFVFDKLRLAGIRQVFGLRIRAGAGGPQTVANIRVADCEFVAGGANVNNNAISVGVEEAATGAKISGVTISGNSFLRFSGEGDGVHVPANGTNCVIENIRIEGNHFEGNAYPVELTPSNGGANNRIQGTQIVRNVFLGNSQAISFYIGNSPGRPTTAGNVIADTVISDNVFTDNLTGLNLASGTTDTRDNQVLRTQILRNTFTGTVGQAILLNHLGGTGQSAANNRIVDTTISENVLTNNASGISLSGGAANTTACQISGTRVVRNRLSGQSGAGISLRFDAGSASNTITDTFIAQNFLLNNASGVFLNFSNASTTGNAILATEISNNIIVATSQGSAVGLFINGDGNRIDGVTMVNDTIADNPLSFPAVTGGLGGTGNTISGVKVINTILWNNAGGDVARLAFFSDVSFCLTADATRAGRDGNFAADPKFFDATGRDYRPRAGSPAIDAATSDGAPSVDFDGRPRFDDPATPNTGAGAVRYFDIGAYEYAPELAQSRLANLSILTSLAAPGDSVTVGTVLGGSGTGGTKPLLVRAGGPSLAALGVVGALPDPKLDVFSGQTVVATNDNWSGATALSAAFAQVGAFAYAPAASKDAAVFNPLLPAGAYSVQVSGVGGSSGAVLAELYDATPANAFTVTTPRLVNVSVLKQINAGEILTAGFVISGATPKQVLIRAVGPTLGVAPFSIPGAMADPKLDLFSGQTVVNSNNDWGTPVGTSAANSAQLSAAFANVGAFALGGATSRDAALLATLTPGNYTAQVAGVNGSAGLVLVEVYEVP